MSAPQRRRRGDRGGGGHEGADERWLLTYADMITLLMALFIVMWAISSTNITKFKELKQSLNQAFSGKIISGNEAILVGGPQILQQGAEGREGSGQAFFDPKAAILEKMEKATKKADAAALQHETESLQALQTKVRAYAHAHGFDKLINTRIDERGLVVRLLTDEVLFPVGSARLQSGSLPLLAEISRLLAHDGIDNPVRVEGNTDSQPIRSSQFPSNWELSTARAAAVLQVLLQGRVPAERLSVTGYADQKPIASNATAEGRAKNRHVDLVVLRRAAILGGS